jgi:hypothetical protein
MFDGTWNLEGGNHSTPRLDATFGSRAWQRNRLAQFFNESDPFENDVRLLLEAITRYRNAQNQPACSPRTSALRCIQTTMRNMLLNIAHYNHASVVEVDGLIQEAYREDYLTLDILEELHANLQRALL